jgi:hypothetical protein
MHANAAGTTTTAARPVRQSRAGNHTVVAVPTVTAAARSGTARARNSSSRSTSPAITFFNAPLRRVENHPNGTRASRSAIRTRSRYSTSYAAKCDTYSAKPNRT